MGRLRQLLRLARAVREVTEALSRLTGSDMSTLTTNKLLAGDVGNCPAPARRTMTDAERQAKRRAKLAAARHGASRKCHENVTQNVTLRDNPKWGEGGSFLDHDHSFQPENKGFSDKDDGHGLREERHGASRSVTKTSRSVTENVTHVSFPETNQSELRQTIAACGCKGPFMERALQDFVSAGVTAEQVRQIWLTVCEDRRVVRKAPCLLWRVRDAMGIPQPETARALDAWSDANWQARRDQFLAKWKSMGGAQ